MKICFESKIGLLCTYFLYICESWKFTIELQQRIQALEIRCCRTIRGIFYIDCNTNDVILDTTRQEAGPLEELITMQDVCSAKLDSREIFQAKFGDKYEGGEFSCRSRLSRVLKTKSKVCLSSFEQSSTFFINWSTFFKMSESC